MLKASFLSMALLVLASLAPVHAVTQTATFSQTISFDGVTVKVSGTFTVDTTAKTLSGTASVSVVNSTSGATIASKTFSISLSFGSSTSGSIKFVLAVPTASLMLGVTCTVATGSTPAAACMVSRDPDINHSGAVDIIDFGVVSFDYGAVLGDPRYNPAADLNANGVIDLIDIGIVGADYGAPVFL